MVTINPNSYVTTQDGDGAGQSLTNFTLVTPSITTPTITGGTVTGSQFNNCALSNPTISGGTLYNMTITGGTLTDITYTSITATTGTFSNLNSSGNLSFTGASQRIKGDFSNATVANRTLFQTSTADSMTSVRAIPNGTSQESNMGIVNNSSPANSSELSFRISATEAIIQSSIFGTGTYLPLNFYTNNTKQATLDTSGNLTVVGAGKLGYGTGAGGTQTQQTNKSTTVQLDKTTGQITMNGAQLNANTTVSFTFTNSAIAATDLLVVNHVSGGTSGSYQAWATSIGAGSCKINVRNITGGNLSEAIVLGFAVIKGATS